MNHEVQFETDDEGWDIAICSCEWTSPPSPGKDIAAEFWADHLMEPVQAFKQAATKHFG